MATTNPPTNGIANGTKITNGEVKSSPYGKETADGLIESAGKASAPGKYTSEDLDLVLQSFRLLIADLCQQFNMGHPG